MTVVLNEAAIARLLDTPAGPVGLFVVGKAERITLRAQQNIRAYFASAPSLDVDQDVGFEMEGSTARVGIKDAGTKSRRMAQSQADGRVNWLGSAIEAGRAP